MWEVLQPPTAVLLPFQTQVVIWDLAEVSLFLSLSLALSLSLSLSLSLC
eukprot:COSAG03_NODE_9005_length_752_cov_1.837672_2_plen_48_part_01